MSNPTDPGAPEAVQAGEGANPGTDAPARPSMASRIDALMATLDDEEGVSATHGKDPGASGSTPELVVSEDEELSIAASPSSPATSRARGAPAPAW